MAQLPQAARPFEGTEFPFPVCEALFGESPDSARLRREAEEIERQEAQPHEAAWTVLAAAEAVESVQPDRQQWFVRDGQFRGMVFTGVKWRAGWALMMGEGQPPYAQAFGDAGLMVFCTRQGVEPGRFLGERETASIYFAQVLARYALVYSDVEAGARHELTHFLEDHGPGVIVVSGPMKPVESLMCLSLLRLGLRAVVVPGFPWEAGDRVEAASPQEAVEAAGEFENLRVRSQQDLLAALPKYANPAHAHEKFEPDRHLGGDGSFLLVRQGEAEEGAEVVGEPEGDLGLLVTIEDSSLDGPAAEELEGAAAGYLNLLQGLRVESVDPLRLALSAEAAVTGEQMGEVIRRGLRLEYPRLGPIGVSVVGDGKRLLALAQEAGAERERQRESMEAAAAAEVVYSCESCAPFSREHLCLAHPLRGPMCGRRWTEMLVGARYMSVSAGRPWRRRGRPENCCAVVPLGKAIDPLKGEYAGLNHFAREATGGRIQRVFLHSVREHPHSSCGCFYALAWWSEDMGGIGLMQRGFDGTAPDGSTWNSLANRAGGKQQPGITGVGLAYMRSPLFLQGDGGWRAVKWITPKLQDELKDTLPDVMRIPTEAAGGETKG
jgi:acetyl-CoA decarbonylase/synthase complex subunit beta